jgi:hypothetical protein
MMQGAELLAAMRVEARAWLNDLSFGRRDVQFDEAVELRLAERFASLYLRGGIAALADEASDLSRLRKVPL